MIARVKTFSSSCLHLWTFIVVYGYLCEVQIPESGLERLEFFVELELTKAKMTRAELAARGGPSRTTLRKAITEGRSTLTATSLGKYDAAFEHWPKGMARAIVEEGATPPPLPDECTPDHTQVMGMLSRLTEEVGSLREAVRDLTERGGGGTGGPQAVRRAVGAPVMRLGGGGHASAHLR